MTTYLSYEMRRKSAKLIWTSKNGIRICNKFAKISHTKTNVSVIMRKTYLKYPLRTLLIETGQDMVDMDKLYIHIIDTLNCFLIVC